MSQFSRATDTLLLRRKQISPTIPPIPLPISPAVSLTKNFKLTSPVAWVVIRGKGGTKRPEGDYRKRGRVGGAVNFPVKF